MAVAEVLEVPERRWDEGIPLSDRASMKSLTMNSRLEKVSKVKLGPLGNIDLPPAAVWGFSEASGMVVEAEMRIPAFDRIQGIRESQGIVRGIYHNLISKSFQSDLVIVLSVLYR